MFQININKNSTKQKNKMTKMKMKVKILIMFSKIEMTLVVTESKFQTKIQVTKHFHDKVDMELNENTPNEPPALDDPSAILNRDSTKLKQIYDPLPSRGYSKLECLNTFKMFPNKMRKNSTE